MRPTADPTLLTPAVDPDRDHALGPADAEMTLVEYGSYACAPCHAAQEVVRALRDRFGERMRYAFRHLPVAGNDRAMEAAVLAEYVAQTTGRFWPVHEALMQLGPAFSRSDLERVARDFGVPADLPADDPALVAARARVRQDVESARRSGAELTPTFFINGRLYTGPWDESSVGEAMLGSLGHRLQTAAFEFVRWGPSSGVVLGLATVLALVLSNSPVGEKFAAWWDTPAGIQWGRHTFVHSLLHWIDNGLLTVFFFVVGLEIKREFLFGHLATIRSAALPVIAAVGGIVLPAILYASIAPPEFEHGWGIPIGTDTAFAVAAIVLLGARVPIELRVFLTAAVITDDIVAILVIALFYTGGIEVSWLVAAGALTGSLILLNRAGAYNALLYAGCGVVLWFLLHEAGLHATLAGVMMAFLIPARPPRNAKALLSQAAAVIHVEDSRAGEPMRSGPSEPGLDALHTILRRLQSPADKLLRAVEPWSSYVVLPIFALANAGVAWTPGVVEAHGRLIAAITLGLVAGKPIGLLSAAWLAVRAGIAVKPVAYSWRQLGGAAALGGIGFTMSLFIAGIAFPDRDVYAAAKIAILLASVIAGGLGALILLRHAPGARGRGPDGAP